MIRIFDEGQGRERAGAIARGGLLVAADERPELEKLLGLCIKYLDGRPRGGPYLASEGGRDRAVRPLYADLIAGGVQLNEATAPKEQAWQERIETILKQGTFNQLEGLALALGMCLDAWREPEVTPTRTWQEDLRLLLAVADPGRSGDGDIEIAFDSPTAALVIQPGSLVVSFATELGVKGYGWVIGVVAKAGKAFGRTAQAAGRRLFEGAREHASARAKYQLRRFEDPSSADSAALRDRQLIIVFLHGLFSTDLATFDAFIEHVYGTNPSTLAARIEERIADAKVASAKLPGGRADVVPALIAQLRERVDAFAKTDPERARHLTNLTDGARSEFRAAVDASIGFAGWPHNTLTAISVNANALADNLDKAFSPAPPKILFVCHSRGGLVARAASANLIELENRGMAWGKALIGIVTFGTPHDGASLAEHSLRDLATYYLLAQSTGKVASLTDVLTYLDARTAEGIEQLKRDEATTESREQAYLDKLYAKERELKDGNGRRRPAAIAIGGVLDQNVRGTWRKRAASALVTRWLDTPDHDLVVELDSSLSKRLDAAITVQTTSDHFGYFEALRAHPGFSGEIPLARVWSEIDLGRAFDGVNLQPPVASPKGPLKLKPRPE